MLFPVTARGGGCISLLLSLKRAQKFESGRGGLLRSRREMSVGTSFRTCRRLRSNDGLLSRNLTDNSSERNELHMKSGGLFSDSL